MFISGSLGSRGTSSIADGYRICHLMLELATYEPDLLFFLRRTQ